MKMLIAFQLVLGLFLVNQAQARTTIVRDNCDTNLNNHRTIDPSCETPHIEGVNSGVHSAYWRDHGTPIRNLPNSGSTFTGVRGTEGTNLNTGSLGVTWNTGSDGANWNTGSDGANWNTGTNGASWNTGTNGVTWETGTHFPLDGPVGHPNYFNNGTGNTGHFNDGNNNSGWANTGNGNGGWFNDGNGNNGWFNDGNYNDGSLNDGNGNGGSHNVGNNNTGHWNSGNGNSGSGNDGNGNGGHRNFGNYNEGSYNFGNGNDGDHNDGDNNTGNWNDGNGNGGDNNVGNGNTGNRNYGNYNSGSHNSGNGNDGDHNDGDNNTGHYNDGNGNGGNRNVGNGNTGNRNYGNYNVGSDNSGNGNDGDHNDGDNNTGHYNDGNGNGGNRNVGNGNTGNRNFGNYNVGSDNSGNGNDGDHNDGNNNTGHWNSGNGNGGDYNSGGGNGGSYNIGNYNGGSYNIGNLNTGNGNLGDNNSGNNNWGNANLGDYNTGNRNDGHYNIGDDNTGDRNLGNRNVGFDNTGDDNVGDRNLGDRNTGNDNFGNENRGNGNQGDGNIGDYHIGDFNEDEKKLYAHVTPIVFGNIDGMDRVENLTPQSEVHKIVEGALPLDLDNFKSGFFVQKSRKYSIGLGVGTSMGFDRAGDVYTGLVPFSASVGVAVSVGSTVTFSTYVESEDEIKSVKRKIPFMGSELDKWKTGDKVMFEMTGGLQVSASAGYYGVTLGGAFMLQGNYKTEVQKLKGSLASINILTGKMKGGAISLGAYGASASVSFIDQKSKRFKFVIDLADKDARDAYQWAMVGWLAPLQRLAMNPAYIASVVKVESEKNLLKGYTLALGISTPYVPVVSLKISKSRFYSKSHLVNHVEGYSTETEYGIMTKEKKARVVTLHTGTTTAFYGGISKLMKGKKVYNRDLSGFFTWQYEHTHGKSSRLRRSIRRLKRYTGLGSLVDVEVPGKEKLGYVNASFRVKFPKAYNLYLIDVAKAGKLDKIKARAMRYMKEYLKSGQKLYAGCNSDNHAICRAGRKAKINRVFKRISRYLKRMATIKDSKKFAKEFAKLGEQIWRNQFTFKAFFEEGKKCGVSLDYKVAGRRISLHKKNLKFPVTAACRI